MGERVSVYAVNENGESLSSGTFIFSESAFHKGFIKALIAGGINTPVHNRRGGNIRLMFDTLHREAIEKGAAVALLHPFSFSYYRKFGYEKVSDHLIASCPVRMLDFVDRKCDLVKYTNSEQVPDLVKIYNEFANGRNLLVKRHDGGFFHRDIPNRETYIYYDNGEPSGYVTYTLAEQFVVNRMTCGVITVEEIAYTSPKALSAIFSFLRLFEGEMEDIVFSNIAMCPEIELMLSHYNHTSYKRVPDVMARVLNTEALLKASEYPKSAGSFTVRVEDVYDSVKGTFLVNWNDCGECEVSRLDDGSSVDLELSAEAFARLAYGYDGVDANRAQYMNGVKINNPDTKFFAVFRKRFGGNFEHF